MRKKDYTAGEVVAALYDAYGVITDAAKLLGCDRTTVYRYADNHPEVKEAMKAARRSLVGEAQGYLVGMMRDPEHRDHYKAVMKVLATYDEEEDWSDRRQLTGANRGPVEVRGIDFSVDDEEGDDE